MNLQDQKYYKKLKSLSSAEPNYLSQFEMRYPVGQIYGGDFAKICGLLRIYEL